jgi:RNA polymerase sigma factor (sigma-70 family)
MGLTKEYADQQLIAAMQNEREMDEAIRFIYRNYYGLLQQYVINNKGTKDDAADIIQETIVAFIEIVQQKKFRGESSVKSFLYSVTRNLWLSELRRKNSADNRNRVFEQGKEALEETVVQHLIGREHYRVIQDLFESLGDKCKQLLLLVYYENLSMKDIMEKMSQYQNEQVLRNKKYKCMKQLEQMMHENEALRVQFKNALKHGR